MDISGPQMNDIVEVQNRPEQLTLRKAARKTYDNAKYLAFLQAILLVGLPVLGAVIAIIWSWTRPFVAALALGITVLDVALLDRKHKQILKRAARFSEKFDCVVLEMPWDHFAAGDPPNPEDTYRASRKASAAGLTDWYSAAVGRMPTHLARLVCQRCNLRYDSSLRRTYAARVLSVSIVVLVGLLAYGFAHNMQMTALTLTIAPATPALSWSWREYFRQKDTADGLEELMKKAQKVWTDALAGKCTESECLLRSREFQGAILTHRSSAPPVLPLLYISKRAQLEDEMNAAAYDFMKEYLQSRGSA